MKSKVSVNCMYLTLALIWALLDSTAPAAPLKLPLASLNPMFDVGKKTLSMLEVIDSSAISNTSNSTPRSILSPYGSETQKYFSR